MEEGGMKLVFERQLWHYLSLAGLLFGLSAVSKSSGFFDGGWLGITTHEWLVISVSIAVAHQFYVWFVWRAQLHLGLITRAFGGNGFKIYGLVFILLFLGRFVSICALAVSNRWSFGAGQGVLTLIAAVVLVPAAYTSYSVLRYFTIERALGIDHFDPEYRKKGFVREGIFRYTGNGMYTFGFLFMWVPGLVFASKAGLAAALFSHAYIWVHYFTLEKPDIRRIYGKK